MRHSLSAKSLVCGGSKPILWLVVYCCTLFDFDNYILYIKKEKTNWLCQCHSKRFLSFRPYRKYTKSNSVFCQCKMASLVLHWLMRWTISRWLEIFFSFSHHHLCKYLHIIQKTYGTYVRRPYPFVWTSVSVHAAARCGSAKGRLLLPT